RESHTEIRNIALRCTVISVPVGLEPRKIAAEINATEPHTELRSVASETVLAGRRRQLEARFLDPIPRDDLNDAAGRVAVQRRERPAQHLDALSAVQVEQSRLALPVRHRQRNAVLDQTDAAHAERSARAESARRDLQVLSVGLAVLHDDAWHASKTLRQVYAQLVLSKDLAVDRIDCRGRAETVLLRACRRDDDGVDRFAGRERFTGDKQRRGRARREKYSCAHGAE